jgi:hypothetical protein
MDGACVTVAFDVFASAASWESERVFGDAETADQLRARAIAIGRRLFGARPFQLVRIFYLRSPKPRGAMFFTERLRTGEPEVIRT